MIAKIAVFVCLLSTTFASITSGWSGADAYLSSIAYGHGSYSTYVSPSYTVPIVAKAIYAAPVVTKAVVPAYSYAPYAPAISTVSRYQLSSPIIKSYEVAPIVKSYVAPVSSYSSYTSAYPVLEHGGYTGGYSNNYYGGYSGYGYGGHGTKYAW